MYKETKLKQLKTNIFTVGFFSWWTYGILSSMELSLSLSNYVIQGLRLFGLLLLVADFFLTRKIDIKRFLLALIIAMFILFNNVMLTSTHYFFEIMIIVFAGVGIDFKSFLKKSFYYFLLVLTLIVGLASVNLIPNVTMFHNGRMRNMLGFNWPSFSAHYYLYIVSLAIIVRGKKITAIEIAILESLNIFIYLNTRTKSPFYLVTAFLILWFVFALLKYNISNLFIVKWGFLGFLPMISYIVYYLSMHYLTFTNLNQMLTGRLRLGNNALIMYPLTLLGKKTSLSAEVGVIGQTYAYVDSSFLQYMIKFGMISFIIFIGCFMMLQWRIIKYKNMFVLLAMSLVIFDGMFDPEFIQANYNVYFVLLATLLEPSSQWLAENESEETFLE
ncbi:hypothetical protein NVV78_00935 [Pediococcus ethanolidurans]|uniref:hypothetical protein n=1 Tax=Pediococcus ethanolidurans TaxID=319653 RepID=UPI0021E78BBD|nr:hypothetical protein [Pediococcus ethanolidurans]MCV3314523.1 hypothetical protein [Pediococcus ethanolidurans]